MTEAGRSETNDDAGSQESRLTTLLEEPVEVGTVPYRTARFQLIGSLHYTAIERKVVLFTVLLPTTCQAVDRAAGASGINRSSRSPPS
jgi:hypothetical protein